MTLPPSFPAVHSWPFVFTHPVLMKRLRSFLSLTCSLCFLQSFNVFTISPFSLVLSSFIADKQNWKYKYCQSGLHGLRSIGCVHLCLCRVTSCWQPSHRGGRGGIYFNRNHKMQQGIALFNKKLQFELWPHKIYRLMF